MKNTFSRRHILPTKNGGAHAAAAGVPDGAAHSPRRDLAKKIADALFTEESVDRLVIELKGGKLIGGWCRKAATDHVEEILKRETKLAYRAGKKLAGCK